MKPTVLLISLSFLMLVLTGCKTSEQMPLAPDIKLSLKHKQFIMLPLHPDHTALDYKAVMTNKEHLRQVLGWNGWPNDKMTEAEDRSALENHYQEFLDKIAYAYAVFTPDKNRIIGCVYMTPKSKSEMTLEFWTTKDQLKMNLDRALFEYLLKLIPHWGYTSIYYRVGKAYDRGNKQAVSLNMRIDSTNNSKNQQRYIWKK